jgi:hypothetical protein
LVRVVVGPTSSSVALMSNSGGHDRSRLGVELAPRNTHGPHARPSK